MRFAVRRLSPERLDKMVKAGMKLDCIDKHGENILVAAASSANAAMMDYLRTQSLEVNTEFLSRNGNSWDALRFVMICDEISLGIYRSPSKEEAHAFDLLLCDVRDRNLKHEIDMLRSILESILNRDGEAAIRHLSRCCNGKGSGTESYRLKRTGLLAFRLERECGKLLPRLLIFAWMRLDRRLGREGHVGTKILTQLITAASENSLNWSFGYKRCPLCNPSWHLRQKHRPGWFGRQEPRKLPRSMQLRGCRTVSEEVTIQRWLEEGDEDS
ncbi:hypothetical protein QBC38DRAFT_6155 [Podospora fimiseda]|uniref:Uncharacterized protein n=1 Tax=Podospora fimiseda TaxID=252190 RepID=A0AAN7BZP1_9PEZI|nr:hypothetical protein QBC38DRAFT_6155 [Podospora fimiseda]